MGDRRDAGLLSVERLIDRLIATAEEFTGDVPQLDDMTIVVLKVETRECRG